MDTSISAYCTAPETWWDVQGSWMCVGRGARRGGPLGTPNLVKHVRAQLGWWPRAVLTSWALQHAHTLPIQLPVQGWVCILWCAGAVAAGMTSRHGAWGLRNVQSSHKVVSPTSSSLKLTGSLRMRFNRIPMAGSPQWSADNNLNTSSPPFKSQLLCCCCCFLQG